MTKKSFFNHNEGILDKKTKITRSSTLFYYKSSNEISTQVHFLNYWLEKRENSDVEMRITLRTMLGNILLLSEKKLDRRGSYTIDVDTLLKDINEVDSNEGSIELEFFSKEDLFISFPAVVVRYIGDSWHTSAHSCQRKFSKESGDPIDKINELFFAEEGNVTINNEESTDSFFIIHNGPLTLKRADLSVIVTSENGNKIKSKVFKYDWKSHQTRVFNLRDMIDYKSFLNQKIGTYTVNFEVKGVFSRIIMGERDYEENNWSIDHSNFAATEGPVLNDLFETSSPSYRKNLIFNVPNNSSDGWECGVDIFPTYPDDNYMVYISKSGLKENIHEISLDKKSKKQIHRIDCSKEGNFQLSFDHEKFLPRRFHIGINYRIGEGRFAFLTDGPMPYLEKNIYSRWMPIFDTDKCQNYILIANRSFDDSKSQEILFEVSLFNSFGDAPLISNFKIDKFESKRLDVRSLFNLYDDYLKGDSGWIYLRSNIANIANIHYASVKSKKSLAIDHAF